MNKLIIGILCLSLNMAPFLNSLTTDESNNFDSSGEILKSEQKISEVENADIVGFKSARETSVIFAAKASTSKKVKEKKCNVGYAVNKATNRCKKLVTITESTSTITTKTWNPITNKETTTKVCKSGYWWNKQTERCNKKAECKIGYKWISSTNKCQKIVCSFGFKVQDASNICKRIICKTGYIINQSTGNCVKNNHGKYKECEKGWTLDLKTLKCAKIGTKGSDDPNSKKSQNEIKKFATISNLAKISTIKTASEIINEQVEDNQEKCPEGKFLNPLTNRCKNIQTITESSTGKTITTYNTETGEATTIKVCNDGYYLNVDTNRCNKIQETKITSTTKSSTTTKTCPEGKFLNPKTNRCKNLQTISESSTGKTITTYDPKTGESKTEKICNEGYELNPGTNRCNKKKVNSGEDYALEVPELGSSNKTNFAVIWSVIGVISIGVGLIAYQFKDKIKDIIKHKRTSKK